MLAVVSATNVGVDTDVVQFSVEIVVKTEHIQIQCWFKPIPQRGTHVPFATVPKNQTISSILLQH